MRQEPVEIVAVPGQDEPFNQAEVGDPLSDRLA
jgi:hypothetical protein